jgi:hypothetical protein
MKRVLMAVMAVAIAHTAFAGVTFKVESVSTGIRDVTISGNAIVEGGNARFNVAKGDGTLFTDSSFVIAKSGGQTIAVVDPSTKSYYELRLDQLSGGLATLLQQLGGMVTFTVAEPKVNVRDLGTGPKMAGYPTAHKTIESSYDLNLNVMGQKTKVGIATFTETWVTDQIPSEFATFLQMGDFHTGVAEIDKLMAANAKAIGGFPLKQISTMRFAQNDATMTTKTTTTVSAIEKKDFAVSEFAIPAGYVKSKNPIEKMMESMGR